MANPVLSLDGAWHFVRDPEARLARPIGLPEGELIDVPGCWEAQVPDPFGIVHAWIWRDVTVPADWPEEGDPIARFGAVMYRCETWLDDRRVGRHEGGYAPFDVPLTGARRGRPSRLALRITNPMNAISEYPALSDERLDRAERRVPELPIRELPHGKQTWYASHSGIWRSVSLEHRPPRFIGRLRAGADWATGRVRVTAEIGGPPDGGTIDLAVSDPEGAVVARTSVRAKDSVETALEVADRRAWDIGLPNLYRLEARLMADDALVHEATVRFGFREIRTESGRIILNGRPILLRGALDQDVFPDTIATPPSRELLDRQLRIAREMGLNLLRCHIKVPDPAYLDAADESGMLLWCELPNWLRMTPGAARRGEELLEEMVLAIGDHPSVVIWTVINEDWGTDLRHSAADRRWLMATVRRLRDLDPTRLVVDNSPCPTADDPNFHLDTDLADFHRYAAMPDAAARWSEQMAELAERPAWLWSPHGDARPGGDEPVVLSEFGTWGLPDPGGLEAAWWSRTGDGPARPDGLAERFAEQRLDRVWADLPALAAATRELQEDALRYQVGEIRRHRGLAGMVVTELTDAMWEANGLLSLTRTPKMPIERVAESFGATILILDLPRRDLWSGEEIAVRVTVSAERAGRAGALNWRLGEARGSVPADGWAACGPTDLGQLRVRVPEVAETVDLDLVVTLVGADGVLAAMATLRCAVVPAHPGRGDPLRVIVRDPPSIGGLTEAFAADAPVDDPAAASVVVTSLVTQADLDDVAGGARLLLLARSPDAIAVGCDLPRPIRIQPRWPAPGLPGADHTWTGDWIGAWSWILPELSSDLPRRAPLDFAYGEVLPHHVLTGYQPDVHADEVSAGLVVGWLHAPVALLWSFPHGRGRLTVTTLELAAANGPTATVLRDAVLRLAAS
ncbi:MAG: hypothetical protein H0U80_05315 [Solirubrobacterales bacterium]|nr:hypothetical protein [Solirubrobacterales bacterium]